MAIAILKRNTLPVRTGRNSQIKASLKYSILDGSAWAAMMGLTQNYVTPFALRMNAANGQISLLSSIPAFLTAIAQLLSPRLLEKAGSRKKLILPMIFLNAVMFIPIMLVPYLFASHQVWWLMAFMTISTVSGAVVNPAWGSMMADLVPMRLRGRFFGTRGMINGMTTLVFSFIASGILTMFTGGNIFNGFVVLFSAAMGFRLLSLFFLSKQYEPLRKITHDNNTPSIACMIRQMVSTNLGKFMLYVVLIDFCVAMSGPFFSVYMLRDLQYTYIQFTMVCSASAVATMIFLNYWGKRADSAGNMKIIKITTVLMPVVPVLWLGSTNVLYLIAANMFSGFVWAGYSLSSVNFVYDATDPSIRHKQLAVFNGMDGLACCIGFLVGGIVVDKLPDIFGYQLRSIMVLSGIGRGLVVLFLLRQLAEVRHVSSVSTWNLMKIKPENIPFKKRMKRLK